MNIRAKIRYFCENVVETVYKSSAIITDIHFLCIIRIKSTKKIHKLLCVLLENVSKKIRSE